MRRATASSAALLSVATAACSHPFEVLILQRQRADALTGRREDRVKHRRGCDRDRRLPDATPEIAGRHDDDLDLWHLVDPHHVVAIEIGLLNRATIDRAFAIQRRGEAIDKRAGDLALYLRRVDRVTGIGGGDDAVDPGPAIRTDRHL